MTTHGTPVFHLYPNLPRDIQTVILNDLSFTDLINFCSVVMAVCLDEQYFQQRLVSKSLDDPFIINRYQSLAKIFPPKDAYVKTLIDTKQINRDPSLLIYLAAPQSDILFPGLEYFIGLTKMGQRAIDLDRSDYLLYVLQLYPNSHEIKQILGALYLKYMDWIHDPKTKDHPFPLLDQSLLHHLFQVNSRFPHPYLADPYEPRYYPQIEPDYQAYREGFHGLPPTQKEPTQKDKLIPYFCGLIDGRQIQLFEDNVQLLSFTSGLLSSTGGLQVKSYAAKRGTLEMVRAMFDARPQLTIILDSLFFAAVHGNNVPVVDFLLTEHRDELSPDKVSPRSLEMLDLLRSHHILVSNEDIFTEALKLGNYALLFGTFGENWYESQFMGSIDWLPPVFVKGPAYIMSAYFTKFHEPNTEEYEMDIFVNNHLALFGDLYREEILLSLGYKPDDEAKEGIITSIENNVLVQILGLNLDRYPHLSEIYHKRA